LFSLRVKSRPRFEFKYPHQTFLHPGHLIITHQRKFSMTNRLQDVRKSSYQMTSWNIRRSIFWDITIIRSQSVKCCNNFFLQPYFVAKKKNFVQPHFYFEPVEKSGTALIFFSVRYQRHFGADTDPDRHLWLMDLAPNLASDPYPTPFFSDFKDAKKINFFFVFFITCLTTGTLSSVLKL